MLPALTGPRREDGKMEKGQRGWKEKMSRALVWTLVLWLGLAATAAFAQEPAVTTGAATTEAADNSFWGFLAQIWRNLFNSRGLLNTLAKPEFAIAAFIALNVIVFTETGLLIGFFLPGDSLLVTAGVACYMANREVPGSWNLSLLLITLCISAIVGDSVGYSIGYKTGHRIFSREKSWFFKKEHLLKAQEFYEKHGGKTIILARFMPIIRTFAPVVAGVARMDYRRFVFFNVIGGVGWVLSMVLIGFYLTAFINPAFRTLLGNPHFDVKDHIEKVVIVVVLLSISPAFIMWARKKWGGKPQSPPAAQPQAEFAQAAK
jgi:membrane-associated protein